MTITFRKAVRENVGLLLGVVGASGSGKTYSAMRLAKGISGDKPFAVIDTEARRALHYADMFNFDHADLHAPFRPDAYAEAIKAADDAGYKVIVVDSMSHEWAGEGGILDWQEDELDRMAGDDWKKREACKMAAWIKPKMSHKQMVQRLLQVRATVIFCFRAEEKVAMEKENGKTVIVPKGFQPICEKNMMFEMTASFLLLPDKPGYPQPIKLQEQHKPFVQLNAPLDENAGMRMAQWANGAKEPEAKKIAYDYDAALDAMRAAKSEAQLKSAFVPAAKRAKTDGDAAMLDVLTKVKDECKEAMAGSISGDQSEGDLNIPALGGKAVI